MPRVLALPLRHTCLISECNVRAAFYMRDHAGMCYFVLPLSKQFRLKCPEAMARLGAVGSVRCCIVYSFCLTENLSTEASDLAVFKPALGVTPSLGRRNSQDMPCSACFRDFEEEMLLLLSAYCKNRDSTVHSAGVLCDKVPDDDRARLG